MKKAIILFLVFITNLVVAQTRFSHNTNHTIWIDVSAACITSGPGTINNNRFIRVFDTDDFGIQDTVFFVFIELGVESTSGGNYDLVGRVYKLQGDLQLANFTLLASDTAAIYPDSTLYKMNIPFNQGYALPGDTIVAEVFAEINAGIFFNPGTNPYPETDESFIVAEACGALEPTAYIDIGYPTVRLVQNLWVNHKPKMTNLSSTVFKDNELQINKIDFDNALIDHDNDTLVMLQIMSLPTNGLLENNAVSVSAGDTIWSNEIDDLTYTPSIGFVGADNFEFRIKDNYHWSNQTITSLIDVLDWTISITENTTADLKIYPNPVKTYLQIEMETDYEKISIYSASGKLVESFLTPVNSLDVSNYTAGMYFVLFSDNEKYAVQTFVKE